MGQPIEVTPTVVDEVLILDADRSVSGQDGAGYSSTAEAESNESFPAKLAVALFASDDAINHVFAGSNGIVIRRSGGWDSATQADAVSVVQNFFVFY
jgi:hypothetical protein